MKYKPIISLLILLSVFTISFSLQVNIGDELSISIPSDEISLLAGNSKSIPFTILNNSTNTIKIEKIYATNGVDIQIDDIHPSSIELSPGNMEEGAFTISSVKMTESSGILSLNFKYEIIPSDNTNPKSYIKYFPINFEIISPPDSENIMGAKIHEDDNSIYEGNLKKIILEIQNLSSSPIIIDRVIVSNSGYINFYPEICIIHSKEMDKDCIPNDILPSPITLSPNQISRFPVYLNLSDTYPHRNILSMFSFSFTYNWGQIQVSDSISVDYIVSASSFEGEKEILGVFGIPIILLLPGFFFMTITIFLWEISHKGESNPISTKDPIFWLLTIVISIILISLYKSIMVKYGVNRDLMIGFNLDDIIRLSIGSIACGFIFISIYLSIENILRLRYPENRDSPRRFLFKLLFYNEGFKFERYVSETKSLFLIKEKRNSTGFWYAPSINIFVSDDALMVRLIQLQLLTEDGSFWQRLKFLKAIHSGIVNHKLLIRWESKTGVGESDKFDLLMNLQLTHIINIKYNRRALPGRTRP